MKKAGIFIRVIVLSCLVAGLYGILHDQVTFSLSEEYFTKFKYGQFRVKPEQLGGHRQTVALIGFLATWWTGLIIGTGLSIAAWKLPDHQQMWASLKKAFVLAFCIVVLSGFTGFLYGKFYLADAGVNWWMPEHLVDKKAFITVGSIHNFGYLGGLIGLLAGVVYVFRQRKTTS